MRIKDRAPSNPDAWSAPADCSLEAHNEMRAQIKREIAEFERRGGKIKTDDIQPRGYDRRGFNNSTKKPRGRK